MFIKVKAVHSRYYAYQNSTTDTIFLHFLRWKVIPTTGSNTKIVENEDLRWHFLISLSERKNMLCDKFLTVSIWKPQNRQIQDKSNIWIVKTGLEFLLQILDQLFRDIITVTQINGVTCVSCSAYLNNTLTFHLVLLLVLIMANLVYF